MKPRPFPDDQWRRRSILVVSQQGFERCQYEQDGGKLLLDDEAHVAVFPPSAEAHPVVRALVQRGLYQPGRTLVLSPFDADVYEDVASADTLFALSKFMHLSAVCKLLGARSVVVEQVDIRTAQGKTTFEVKGGNLQATGKLNVSSEELDRFRGAMTFEDTFDGGEPDVEAAERYMNSHGLAGDPSIRSLVEMNRSSANRHRKRKVVVSLTSESSRNLAVAARLKVPAYLTADARYTRTTTSTTEFTLTIVVTFGQGGEGA